MTADPSTPPGRISSSLRLGIFFGIAVFACMLVWSQLVPLGAGPDEPSNFVKSAAVIRGEFIGEDLDKWILSVDGWVFDSRSGVRRVIILADGQIVGDGVPSVTRQDVADQLWIDSESMVGFSISVRLPNVVPGSYAVYAELNDGTLVILEVGKDNNVVTSPSITTAINGELPRVSKSTAGYIEQSRATTTLEFSYWSTKVDIDPQFGVALQIPWCFAPYPDKTGCNAPIEDQTVIDNPPMTNMGRYPPGGFVFGGIGTLAGPTDGAFRLSRAMNAAVCALLLTLAFVCLRRRSISALPMLIAITPGVIFMSSVISPSGLEICAAVALWAILPGYVAATDRHSFETVCVALSGTFLIMARPLGALLYSIVMATVVIASGSTQRFVTHLRKHKIVYGLHSIAALFMVWWYLFVFNSAVDPQMTAGLPKISIGDQVLHAIGDIPRVIDESIGNYGWLDTPTPRPIALIIFTTSVVLVIAGWRSLTQAARRALGILGIAIVALILAEDFNYYNTLRYFGVQGRHLTPLLVGVPILGARYVRLSRRSAWVIVGIWCGAVAGGGLAALRRYSVGVVGDNALDMFTHPVWSPPLGITWSIVLLIVATSGIGIVAMSAESRL